MENIFNLWCNWITKHYGYVRDLEKILNSLRDKKNELENISKDVQGRVEFAERQRRSRRTNEVKGWLESVQVMLTKVDGILQKGDEEIQKTCWRNCLACGNFCSRDKLGEEASEKIDDVKDLLSKGQQFGVVDERLPRPPLDQKPIGETVGMGAIINQVWRCNEDEYCGQVIGLYGMGGVGKTTLLKKLNNKFLDTNHGFDLVIWVGMFREANWEKIQEVVRKKLEISDEMRRDRDVDERANELLARLRNKKFELLIDDVWESIDLSRAGVSLNLCQNGSKIVFITRSEDVCGAMEAQKKIKVDCLSQEAALYLFRKTVGEDVLNSYPAIPKLAEKVVHECNGLPLALVTIGRAMASRKTPTEWQYAVQELQRASCDCEFQNMENSVVTTLQV